MNSKVPSLTHIDPVSNQPAMVDVSTKAITLRTAKARATVVLGDAIMQQLNNGDIQTKKGSVFQTAIIAGTMAAKRTSELIPFCHPIGLDNCKLSIQVNDRQEVEIECTAIVTAETGVEMGALPGVTIAALTIYDMCKVLSQAIVIRETRLVEKTGGKSDFRSSE